MIEIVRLRSAENGGAVLAECEFSGDDIIEAGGKPQKRKAFLILLQMYKEMGLKKGQITHDLYDNLCEADEKSRAFFAGERLLGYASNSAGQISIKLRRKGFSREAAGFAGEQLQQTGAIDEERDAVRQAELMAKSGKGRLRIIRQLRAKSFGNAAMAAVSDYLDTVDFAEICAGVIRKKWGSFPKDRPEAEKAAAALTRLGFTSSDIREAIRLL